MYMLVAQLSPGADRKIQRMATTAVVAAGAATFSGRASVESLPKRSVDDETDQTAATPGGRSPNEQTAPTLLAPAQHGATTMTVDHRQPGCQAQAVPRPSFNADGSLIVSISGDADGAAINVTPSDSPATRPVKHIPAPPGATNVAFCGDNRALVGCPPSRDGTVCVQFGATPASSFRARPSLLPRRPQLGPTHRDRRGLRRPMRARRLPPRLPPP